jgi:hypothetical protein
MRGWVCYLQLLLAFASIVVLGSEPQCCMDTLLSDGSGIAACLQSLLLATSVFTKTFPSNDFLLASQFWLSADMPQYVVLI